MQFLKFLSNLCFDFSIGLFSIWSSSSQWNILLISLMTSLTLNWKSRHAFNVSSFLQKAFYYNLISVFFCLNLKHNFQFLSFAAFFDDVQSVRRRNEVGKFCWLNFKSRLIISRLRRQRNDGVRQNAKCDRSSKRHLNMRASRFKHLSLNAA